MQRKGFRKVKLPNPDINIVPLMDILVTLLFFILLVATFSNLSIVEANTHLGDANAPDDGTRLKLQLAVPNDETIQIWVGPLSKVKAMNKEALATYLRSEFRGNDREGYQKIIKAPERRELVKELKDALIMLKQSFYHENQANVLFDDSVSYQTVIDIVNSVRGLSDQEPSIEAVNLLGRTEKTRILFPEVLISELDEVK